LQLLISVRAAEEVGPALAGGADIIDAKEPNRGSLGPVDRSVLREIIQRVPERHSVSVALGDVSSDDEVSAALAGLALPARISPTYLKLGFARVDSPDHIQSLIQRAVAATRSMAGMPQIVAVAYADSDRAGTVKPELIPALARAAGAAGVLLDTHGKDGLSLLQWIDPVRLADWVGTSRRAGLLTALAGGLQSGDLSAVCQAQPAVIGIRGAACTGGRWGRVSASRVRQVRRAVERAVGGTNDPGAGAPVAKRGIPGRFLPT
jgi:(5-formylfuran-3-yl)methyl phosphate synthase